MCMNNRTLLCLFRKRLLFTRRLQPHQPSIHIQTADRIIDRTLRNRTRITRIALFELCTRLRRIIFLPTRTDRRCRTIIPLVGWVFAYTCFAYFLPLTACTCIPHTAFFGVFDACFKDFVAFTDGLPEGAFVVALVASAVIWLALPCPFALVPRRTGTPLLPCSTTRACLDTRHSQTVLTR